MNSFCGLDNLEVTCHEKNDVDYFFSCTCRDRNCSSISAGVLTIITAVFLKNSFVAMLMGFGYVVIITIIVVVYSYMVYKKELDGERK